MVIALRSQNSDELEARAEGSLESCDAETVDRLPSERKSSEPAADIIASEQP